MRISIGTENVATGTNIVELAIGALNTGLVEGNVVHAGVTGIQGHGC